MIFVPGDTQSVLSNTGTIFAAYQSPDVIFYETFAIFSLQKLLSILSLYNDPEININDKFLVISSQIDKKVCNYQLTNPDFIKYEKNTDKYKKMKEDYSFDLTFSDFSGIMKLANILKSEFLVFRGDGSKIYFEVANNNENGDSGSIELGETDMTFKVALNKELLNLQENNYKVIISKKGAISFQSNKITYFMAVNKEKSSL